MLKPSKYQWNGPMQRSGLSETVCRQGFQEARTVRDCTCIRTVCILIVLYLWYTIVDHTFIIYVLLYFSNTHHGLIAKMGKITTAQKIVISPGSCSIFCIKYYYVCSNSTNLFINGLYILYII